MKIITKIILIVLLFVSCNSNRNKKVENLLIPPILLIDDLDMSLPGDIIVADSTVLVSKVRANDAQINVYDLNTLQLKTKLCNVGRASNELIQVSLIADSDSVIVAYDLNGKGIFYSLKDFSILDVKSDLGYNYNERTKIGADSYISINREDAGGDLFAYYTNMGEKTFGKFPIEGDFKNRNEIIGGEMLFTTKDSTFHFFSNSLPYSAKYKMVADRFELISENFYNKYNVSKERDGRAVITHDDFLLVGLAFTENYIIRLRRSPEDQLVYSNSAKSVKDFSNLPKHLYLYDYDLNLVKIVNLGVNTLRMGAEGLDSDVVYLICSDDGLFNLSKVQL